MSGVLCLFAKEDNMEKQGVKVYGIIVMAMICWSLSFVWIKIAYHAYNPITVVLFRLVLSSVMLFVFTKISKRLVMPPKKDMKYIFLMAFFEPFLYFLGESFGLKYVSSTVAAVIVGTIPLFAPIPAYFILKEKISKNFFFGVAVSFMGLMIVIFENGFHLEGSFKGIALEFFAVFAALGYATTLRKISDKVNNLTVIFFQNTIGALYFLPLWFIFESAETIETGFVLKPFIAIIELSIFASTLAFIFFTYGVRKIGVTKSNAFVNIIPVFTAIFAWIILGDKLSFIQCLGILIVILGLFVSQIQNPILRKKGPNVIPRA